MIPKWGLGEIPTKQEKQKFPEISENFKNSKFAPG